MINEIPLMIAPSLAIKIGVNEAVILQQVYTCLEEESKHEMEGGKWVYNTYEVRQKQFPFWSDVRNGCSEGKMHRGESAKRSLLQAQKIKQIVVL
ncbi:hypothetical protein V7111_04840 [Neobacillus niacini]|uniref:hypothetical protein n=1 Tax=Neobacillus niacini TaxID=86668 RepID=UPI002FFF0B8A